MPRAVLFTASTFSHIVNFHRPYLRAFREQGFSVTVACGGAVREIPEADRILSLPFEKKMTSPANLAATRLLRQELRRQHYDLIVTHTSLAAFFTRLAAGGRDRPALVNVAHGYLFDERTGAAKRLLLEGAETLMAGRTDLLLTMNRWDYEIAHRRHWGRRVELIPGVGLPSSPLRRDGASGAALRAELGLSPDDFLLLYPAEFSARKNQSMLLRALPLLPERVKLLLPGEGALLPECRELAASLGVSARVRFPGQVSDIPRWLSASDAAVSASRSEGLPFNVMEAMAAGLPILASAVKGYTDLLEQGSGLLYPFDDEAAFAAAAERLLTEPALCRSLSEAAQSAIRPFLLEAVLPQVMALYCSALGEE